MTLQTVHPELEAEQAYVDRAYRYLETMREEADRLRYLGSDPLEEQAFERWKRIRVAALSDTTSTLVFGRIDERAGDTFYIGRHHVRDEDYDTVVVDWRAPVATAFYRAGPGDPMGLHRRRRFLAEGRELLGLADEDLERDETVDRSADEILQRELGRRRGGTMRDVVATIQAEQDYIIRAPLRGLVVVQGGPGTGKTVVGLHRAAFLLYEHRRSLERTGVLVVGPNPVFIRYVSQVLPSLGEAAVTQLPVTALSPVPPRGAEPDEVARLKGEARMAEVVRRALDDRRGRVDDDVELTVGSVRFLLPADEVNREANEVRSRRALYRGGRGSLREQLLMAAFRRYEAALPENALASPFDEVTSGIRSEKGFRKALDRVWPSVSPDRLVADLLTSPARLRRASDGILDDHERRLLRRSREAEAWTVADGPLVDEARALIDGAPERYGHIVVDEAQDLSPMQLRMIARRCPSGSITVLGDLAQATGVWAHDDWDEVTAHLPAPDGSRVAELSVGYRVCASIVEVAEGILAEAMPGMRAPTSVRREPGEVSVHRTDGLAEGAAAAAAQLLEDVDAVALIVPEPRLGDVRRALRAADVPFGEADRQELDEPVVLVGVGRAKGLEFEGVVLVEPAEVVEAGGPRLLYVAVTRAMRRLRVVHSAPLPGSLRAPERQATA